MSTFEERARARAGWPVRAVSLATEELSDPRDVSSVDARLAWVGVLTREQWAFAGLTLPSYARAEMPGRIIRPR